MVHAQWVPCCDSARTGCLKSQHGLRHRSQLSSLHVCLRPRGRVHAWAPPWVTTPDYISVSATHAPESRHGLRRDAHAFSTRLLCHSVMGHKCHFYVVCRAFQTHNPCVSVISTCLKSTTRNSVTSSKSHASAPCTPRTFTFNASFSAFAKHSSVRPHPTLFFVSDVI